MTDQKDEPLIPDPSRWVEEFGDFLFGMAMHRVDRPEVAEDLVQETFLRALKNYQSFRGDSQFKSWLRGILNHVISDFFSEKYRERSVVSDLDMEASGVDIAGLSRDQPDELADRMEVWETLEYCLAQIPRQSAAIFKAIELDGLSNKEIAEQQGVRENNIAVLLHRARKALRDCMVNLFKKGKSD